jgi:hypothetical protein
MLWVGDPLIRCRQVLLATDVGDNSEFTSTPHGMNVDTHPKPATETDRRSFLVSIGLVVPAGSLATRRGGSIPFGAL